MRVVFHIGAPCTDGDQLIVSLLKNRLRLSQVGIAVPQPNRYRAILRDTARALNGRSANETVQTTLMEAIIGDLEANRIVLSDARFICINRLVVQGPQIWPMIDRATASMRNLFPQAEFEFFVGMRDPATLIPALFKGSRFSDFGEFTNGMQPQAVSWSETLRRLRQAQPDAPVTAWCNEDTPLLWGEIMRNMAGVTQDTKLDGVDDLAETIMDDGGFDRMMAWLSAHPDIDETQRRRVVSAFLERYALPSEVEETFNLQGWSNQLMDDLSQAYDEDMDLVEQIPGVTFIQP